MSSDDGESNSSQTKQLELGWGGRLGYAAGTILSAGVVVAGVSSCLDDFPKLPAAEGFNFWLLLALLVWAVLFSAYAAVVTVLLLKIVICGKVEIRDSPEDDSSMDEQAEGEYKIQYTFREQFFVVGGLLLGYGLAYGALFLVDFLFALPIWAKLIWFFLALLGVPYLFVMIFIARGRRRLRRFADRWDEDDCDLD